MRYEAFPSVASLTLIVGISAAPAACDSTQDEDAESAAMAGEVADENRGGPDSLIGFAWTSEPRSVAGIEFEFSFSFDEDSVTLANTCNADVTAVATAPVRYSYSANVPTGGRDEVLDGDESCWVELAAGAFDFEIVEGNLVVESSGTSFVFAPSGSVEGLYGEWTAQTELGTVRWSMGDGRIRATATCDGGLSAEVEVEADFVNRLEFLEASEVVESDGVGLECTAVIERAVATYTFEDGALLMDFGDEKVRLEPS